MILTLDEIDVNLFVLGAILCGIMNSKVASRGVFSAFCYGAREVCPVVVVLLQRQIHSCIFVFWGMPLLTYSKGFM